MKQLIFIVSMLLLCLNMAHAQAIPAVTSGYNSATMAYVVAGDDTAINTDVIDMYSEMTGSYDLVVELTNTKVALTVGGTAYVSGSWDGTNYYPLKNMATQISLGDTATLPNSTYRFAWVLKNYPFRYIKLTTSQNTTGTSAPVGKLWYRPASKP